MKLKEAKKVVNYITNGSKCCDNCAHRCFPKNIIGHGGKQICSIILEMTGEEFSPRKDSICDKWQGA